MYEQTNKQTNKQTVAIVTSTIGRDELVRAIESVKAQTYPCRHYIFVDGEQFADKVKALVEPYQDLVIIYLPMNTGKNGMVNSCINAIAPFLVEEDIICYLDDDNWYEPNHVDELVKVLENGADFAYSLRNFYSLDGRFICPDDFESLGYWTLDRSITISLNYNDKVLDIDLNFKGKAGHIDTNTYAFPRKLAIAISRNWYSGIHNDYYVFNKLKELNLVGRSSGEYSVNYCGDVDKLIKININAEAKEVFNSPIVKESFLKKLGEINIAYHGNKKPWAERN